MKFSIALLLLIAPIVSASTYIQEDSTSVSTIYGPHLYTITGQWLSLDNLNMSNSGQQQWTNERTHCRIGTFLKVNGINFAPRDILLLNKPCYQVTEAEIPNYFLYRSILQQYWSGTSGSSNINTNNPYTVRAYLRWQTGSSRNDNFNNEFDYTTSLTEASVTVNPVPAACDLGTLSLDHGTVNKADVIGSIAEGTTHLTCSADSSVTMSVKYSNPATSTNTLSSPKGQISNRTTLRLGDQGNFSDTVTKSVGAGVTNITFRDELLTTGDHGEYSGNVVVYLYVN